MGFEPNKQQEKEARVVSDPTKDRQPKKAKNFEEPEAKIKAKQLEKPTEQPTETKREEENPAVAEVEKKPAKKVGRQPKETRYPVDLFINAYCFIRISNDMRRDLGWGQKGDITNLTADKNSDGSVRKL